MHQSRLAGFIIDCNVPDLAAAAAFWGAALRMGVKALPDEEGSKYMRLVDPEGRLHIEVQTVTHPSRVHLDIESTDVEAEVLRLEGLGATRVAQVHTWWVMEAPTGQRFCVVRKSSQASALERWHRIVATRDITDLDDLLADDAVFESPAVLEFKTMVGEIEVDGIDMIEWNAAGRISRFKVMVRPVKALQALMPLMATELAKA